MASTVSPTCRSALLPSVAGVRSLTPSAWITARSVAGSRPRISASAVVPSENVTLSRPAVGRLGDDVVVGEDLAVGADHDARSAAGAGVGLEADRDHARQDRGGRLREGLGGAVGVARDPARQARHRRCRGVVVDRQCDQRAARGRHEHQARGGEHRHSSPAPPRGRGRDRRAGGGPVRRGGRPGVRGETGWRRRGRRTGGAGGTGGAPAGGVGASAVPTPAGGAVGAPGVAEMG